MNISSSYAAQTLHNYRRRDTDPAQVLATGHQSPHIKRMLRFTPILLAIGYGIVLYRFSVWRTSKELDRKSVALADPKLLTLCADMARALDLPRIKVSIYDIGQVNGLAAPDGRIFLTRGFLERYKAEEVTAEEIASVIAHELGHVALGHSRRRMIDFGGQNAMRTALAMVVGRFVPFVGPMIASLATSLLAARLSRTDEYEADAYASALLVKAGIGTGPQISLFEKLENLTGANGATTPAWMLSHPKTSERIAAIKKNRDKWLG